MNESIYTVSELNARVKERIEDDALLQNVCVLGELSNYKIYPSGHHYFSLKDAQSALRCVMFRSAASRLRFTPENGMSVAAFGRVSVYPRDGVYQLYCQSLQVQGVGDLQVAFEQLKAKLAAEGLFDPAHKKPIPRFPRRVAVITSGAGAAVRDVIRVSGKRWPMAQIVVLPVRVQGAEAPPEIAGAIRYASRWKVADLIITGRGGGSMEDLWCFNDERVARAIWESELPVISAVGHEPDVTIADYVADLRAATPSNGAELALPDQEEIRQFLYSLETRAAQSQRKRLEALRQRLDGLKSRRVLESPTGYIDQKRQELDFLRAHLGSGAEKTLSVCRRRYVALAASLDAMSPLKVLSRGYAAATDLQGRMLRSAGEIAAGQRFRLRLSDGTLRCLSEGQEAQGKAKGKETEEAHGSENA